MIVGYWACVVASTNITILSSRKPYVFDYPLFIFVEKFEIPRWSLLIQVWKPA